MIVATALVLHLKVYCDMEWIFIARISNGYGRKRPMLGESGRCEAESGRCQSGRCCKKVADVCRKAADVCQKAADVWGDPIFSTKIALPFSPLFRANLKRSDFSGDFGTFIKKIQKWRF